jgi:SlyX protein
MSDSERLDALEFKLAHLERSLNEINEVVIRQQRELDQLRARLQQTALQLESLEAQPDGTSPTAHEKPPHY